jgi:hypothetical protein
MVIRFVLTNAPATFRDMMNHYLKDFRDEGIIFYIDDISINAKIDEKHNRLVKQVLKRLAVI